MLSHYAEALLAQHSGCADSLREITRIDRVAQDLPSAPFFEPVSMVVAGTDGRGTLINATAPMLTAWAQHMAYTMRARMRSFEPGVLRELVDGRTLTAATLLRAHLEASAMAALCVEKLSAAREVAGLEPLCVFIPQTLYGTALCATASKVEHLQELLAYTEQRTIRICNAIDALDRFAYGESANGSTSFLYALLCESAHPNHRGTRPFMSSREIESAGWEIVYASVEQTEPESIDGIVRGLAHSMTFGYATSEMLRVATFVNDPAPYRGLPKPELRRIWSLFIAPDS